MLGGGGGGGCSQTTGAVGAEEDATTETDVDTVIASRLRKGDTAIGVFSRRAETLGARTPCPALVVAVHTFKGRFFVDMAPGTFHDRSPVSPREVVVAEPQEVTAAGRSMPTRFDLRRRLLVGMDDKGRLQRRLGSLGKASDRRLVLSLQSVGDVSPQPVEEGRPSVQGPPSKDAAASSLATLVCPKGLRPCVVASKGQHRCRACEAPGPLGADDPSWRGCWARRAKSQFSLGAAAGHALSLLPLFPGVSL